MPKRSKRTLVKYDADQREIDTIKGKIAAIISAARNTLPDAIEIGEWFVKQRVKIGHGNWENWLGLHFADSSKSTIRYCVQLASEKQFLMAKFDVQIANVGDLNGSHKGSTVDMDIQRFPTIRGALAAIAEKNAPIRVRKGAKRKEPRHGAYGDTPIDVESEIKTPTGHSAPGNMFDIDRGMRIPPPPQKMVELAEKHETCEEPMLPIEQIQIKLNQVSSCLNAAQGFWQDALAIAKANKIRTQTVMKELEQRCSIPNVKSLLGIFLEQQADEDETND